WGEALHPPEISSNEWAGLDFFPIGVTIGMIVAWWKDGLGSAVTLLSLLGFYLVYGYLLRNHIGGWAFIAFASPGFLFLLHWLCATLVKSTTKSSTLSNREFGVFGRAAALGKKLA